MQDAELTDEDRAIVRQTPLFSAMSEVSFTTLLRDIALSRRERGEVLFDQGEPATAFFVVLDGWVKLYRMTAAGDEAIVAVFSRGQSFGEAACFSCGDYPVAGETVTRARILSISARQLAERIREAPEIGLAMLASTSQHLHLLVRQIEELKAQTGAERLAEFLLALASVEDGPCIVMLPYEKSLIAGRLGMKPESLSRAFQRLRPLGVRIERDVAHIADVARLSDFLSRERQMVLRCVALRQADACIRPREPRASRSES